MNWKVFIVYHDNIYLENYLNDKLFSSDNYTYLKVGDKPNKYDFENIIEISNLPVFKPLGKHYAEAEGIYNIYQNPELYENLDYIGFSQYDKPHQFRFRPGNNVTELINENLSYNETHLSLESYNLLTDYSQHIMMDENYPNQLTGGGKNCYDGIIEDYNLFHNTDWLLIPLFNRSINLCSSFIIPIDNFKKIMKFISFIIESGKLDKYDTEHKHRIQGGLLERYFGLAIMLEDLNFIDLSIEHINQK